jgi:hypothetical protein
MQVLLVALHCAKLSVGNLIYSIKGVVCRNVWSSNVTDIDSSGLN